MDKVKFVVAQILLVFLVFLSFKNSRYENIETGWILDFPIFFIVNSFAQSIGLVGQRLMHGLKGSILFSIFVVINFWLNDVIIDIYLVIVYSCFIALHFGSSIGFQELYWRFSIPRMSRLVPEGHKAASDRFGEFVGYYFALMGMIIVGSFLLIR